MAKKKKTVALDLTTRFAMAQEAVERLASSSVHYSQDEDGRYTSRKEDGEIDYRNNISHHEDGIAVIHIDGPLGYRALPNWWGGLYVLAKPHFLSFYISFALKCCKAAC